MSPPKHFWMLFVGMPLVFVGVAMLGAGFMGTTTRYTAGEVMPTVKDSLGYVGIGAKQATCPKCGDDERCRGEILRPLRDHAQRQLPRVRPRERSRLSVLQRVRQAAEPPELTTDLMYGRASLCGDDRPCDASSVPCDEAASRIRPERHVSYGDTRPSAREPLSERSALSPCAPGCPWSRAPPHAAVTR